jgi:16S rRNA processing protein RimM
VELGIISRKHALTGAVIVQLSNSNNRNILKKAESIFIEIDRLLVPFFIEEVNILATNPIVTLQDVENHDYINRFIGCSVFVDQEMLKYVDESRIQKESILKGYTVIDTNEGEIGTVLSLNLIPGNPIIEVVKGDDIILIPYNDSIVKHVDHTHKHVKIESPKGLIELYLK